jgi:ankyrin repeat protein
MTRWMMIAILLSGALAQDDGPKDPLCRAAQNGDFKQVGELLDKGTNPNVRDEQNNAPLHLAAAAHMRSIPQTDRSFERDYVAVARLLLEKGAEVDARDTTGRTALQMAVDGSASEYRVIGADLSLARLLIEHGANINASDNLGWTPLLNVLNLWADPPAVVEFLLAKGADIKARLKDGRTGLMLAAHLGKDDRIRLLIAKGTDVNAHDLSGTTALMTAALVRWDDLSISMIKILAEKGANMNAVDNEKRTAADLAAHAGYIDRAMLLIDRGTKIADLDAFLKRARDYALWRAIADGDLKTAQAMLSQGANPNFSDDAGRTLLTIAADEEYSAERAILLLDHGASVNLAATTGETPLMVAADRYQASIVKVLLDRGGNPNASDRDGNTVLIRAAASKHSWEEERKPLIPLLLAKGADPSRKNFHGVTALMLMALNGNPALTLLPETIDVNARDDEGNTALLYAAKFFIRGWPRRNGWALLQNGADVNAANRKGETALILASTQYEVGAVQLLLEKGANVNAHTKTGRTALMQAIDGPKEFDNDIHVVYSPEIAKLLIASGADVNARDADGNTALTFAERRGYDDMAAALKQAGAKR